MDEANLCLSGGADGADLQWGMCAGAAGHSVIHWSFAEHRTQAPFSEVVRLNDVQLEQSMDALKLAARNRNMNMPRPGFVRKLLQRNYFQVIEASSVYAVGTILDGKVQGGTAWAVQMFLDRQDLAIHPLYVYDQPESSWCAWNDELKSWDAIESPPVPTGIWAGIGSRDLKQNGKEAIRKLMGWTPPL